MIPLNLWHSTYTISSGRLSSENEVLQAPDPSVDFDSPYDDDVPVRLEDTVNKVAGLSGKGGMSICLKSIARHSLMVGRKFTMVWTQSRPTCKDGIGGVKIARFTQLGP